MPLSRRQIVKCCKERGWTIQPLALQDMCQTLLDDATMTVEALEEVLDHLDMKGQKVLTSQIWKQLVSDEDSEDAAGATTMVKTTNGPTGRPKTTAVSTQTISVVNAFETPKLVYEVMRKQFRVEEKRYSIFGTADDKTDMFGQRYAMIHQRVLRNELFRPQDLTRSSTQHKLTPIESLLGKPHEDTLLLLGMLLQIEEGQWYVEDPTGQVPISFQSAVAVDNFFVTEHSVLLVEGNFYDGIFYVQRVGQPLLEARETSLSAIQQQVSHVAYGARAAATSPSKDEPSFVFLSDVHLDQPRVLQQLESLFARYEKYPPHGLPIFVLMGNFGSSSGEVPPLDELGSLLSTFGNLARNAHIVLVPGTDDTHSMTLPHPNTLPRSGFSRIDRVHWATNPCRIRYSGQEVVIFRYDLLHLFQRLQLPLPVTPSNKHIEDLALLDLDATEPPSNQELLQPHCRLIKTILEQGHLCPVAGIPIVWNYDYTLSLYPTPTLLVLGGDGASPGYHELHGGCHVIHPGSMAADGSYATYIPPNDEDSDLEYDDDSNVGGPRVAIEKLGGMDKV